MAALDEKLMVISKEFRRFGHERPVSGLYFIQIGSEEDKQRYSEILKK